MEKVQRQAHHRVVVAFYATDEEGALIILDSVGAGLVHGRTTDHIALYLFWCECIEENRSPFARNKTAFALHMDKGQG